MLRSLNKLFGLHLELRSFSTVQSRPSENIIVDPSQLASLDQEQCIVVDKNDKTIGAASKRVCHRVDGEGKVLLHRAFSVFLFNKNGEMLIQRRAAKKGEREEGIIEAAQRRLNFELGIPMKQMRPDMFTYMTRMHYFDPGDGIWGEHEIDYILMLQNDFDLEPNLDEVSEVQFIPRDNFNNTISNMDGPLTPWFDLVRRHLLQDWWDNLKNLEKFIDHKVIHKFPVK